MTKASDKIWLKEVNDPAGAYSKTGEGITLPDGVSQSKLKSGSYWQDSVSGYWVIYTGASEAGVVREGYRVFSKKTDLEKQVQYVKAKNPINLSEGSIAIEIPENDRKKWQIGPLQGASVKTISSLRYPSDALIDESNDYMYFQFGKYIPPFSRENTDITNEFKGRNRSVQYNKYQASTQLKPKAITVKEGQLTKFYQGIILPMPQDLGNDIQQTWNGKQFSSLGRAAIAGAAGGDISRVGDRLTDMQGNIQSIVASLQTQLLNKLPGVGGNLDIGDITGSTQGIVLNPNAEILYDSPELREIGFTYKLVPRNEQEGKDIREIVKAFRLASLPQWGGSENGESFDLTSNDKKTINAGSGSGKFTDGDSREEESFNFFSQENFMRVPYLCKFSFMKGGNVNRNMQQFKPCAIRKVSINYTSDGTYATYRDGTPVATELTLNFLESKILFRSDVDAGY